MELIDTKGKEFVTIDNWIGILYNESSPSLQVKNWKKLIPKEEFEQFEEDESFLSFEYMLNYIETHTDYTLFQIIPYKDTYGNKIKMIYIHK